MGSLSASLPRSDRLVRPELLHLMTRSREFALTLVLAPAGSGKTTLLNHWERENADRLTARLSLGRRDADPLVFLQHLNHALRRALPDFAVLSCNALNAGSEQADTLADALADGLAASPQELFLLIDDFHYASAPLVQRIFARLLEDLPPQVHLIISSRNHPGFSLSRLKLDDRLLLIDSHDLRLPAEQLPALCAALGVPLPGEQESGDLLRLTEGWMAGLKLALLARARPGRPTPTNVLHGGQPELVDYFAEVVLDGLPAAEREFLLATAILDQFDLALCESLLGAADTGARLEQILQKGLFLQPVEELPGWFRYHPLFHRFLQSRLQQEAPERLQALHLAAARHALANGDGGMALFHARRTGLNEQYEDMLRTVCEQRLHQGRLVAILDSLKEVEATRLRNDPGLFIPQIAALLFTRQFGQARYSLEEVRLCNSCVECPDRIPGKLRYLEKLLALFQDDDGLWYDPEQFQDAGIPYHDLRDSLTAMAARHHLLKGECTIAVRVAGEAKILLGNLGHEYLESFADVIRILAERELGHILAARQMTQDFYTRLADRPYTPGWVTAGTCMGVSLYEQNRTAEARELCEALIQHVDSACATEIVFNVYVTLARLHYIAGHSPRGNLLLQELRRILRHGQYRRLLNQLLAEELAQAIRSGNTAAVKGIAEEYDLAKALTAQTWSAPAAQYREGWVYGGIAAALYLRTRKQFDRALLILQNISLTLAATDMRTRLVVVEANRIVILYLQGHTEPAMRALGELFARVGLQCAIRTIFDEAPGFGDLVRRAHEQSVITLPEVYLQLYADVLYPPEPTVAPPPSGGPEPLTAKELEVLELVRRGLANKEISRELNISLSTTKWHLKNIFAKLQVGNRTSAMAALARNEPRAAGML